MPVQIMQRQSKRKSRKILFKKSRSQIQRVLESLKMVLNQRIHFDPNEHNPFTNRNSFHDSIKDDPMIHVHLFVMYTDDL